MAHHHASQATVEYLTAEVRVLQVGNRQITLSVARQLDYVPLQDMQPFGRIRLSSEERFVVIGRHTATGMLVVARFRPHYKELPHIWAEDLTGQVQVCRTIQRYPKTDAQWYPLQYQGRSILIETKACRYCDTHDVYGSETCGSWSPCGQDAAIQRVIAACDALNQLHQSMKDLPLIVLAGLR